MPRKKPARIKPAAPKPEPPSSKRVKPRRSSPSVPLSQRIDNYLNQNPDKVLRALLGLTLLMGILLFDVRITEAGDDSAYIIRAYDFIHHFVFPGFQGPLYPIVLSPFIGILGIRIIALKFISLLFILGSVWFTWKAFEGRIPVFLLTVVLLLVSVNSYVLYYGSQTYSEAFFIFVQSVTFFVFFRFFIDEEKEIPLNVFLRKHMILALCVLGLALTRSIGFAAVFAIGGYFLFTRQWKNLLAFVVSFGVVLIGFELIKFLVWRTHDFDFSVQVQSLMSKDYYNPALGSDDMMGFITRFIENSNQFLSKYLYMIIGLRASDESSDYYPVLTLLTYVMLLASMIFTFRKNKYIFFTGMYALVFLAITFFIAHTYWAQSRFIVPYIPLILLMLLGLFYYVLQQKQFSGFRWVLPVLVVILFISALGTTLPRVVAVRQVEDKYSGMTPEWSNYCKISEWVSTNLTSDALVACRKPSISFIYGHGRRFYGITRIPSYPADSILVNWKQKNNPFYMIAASSIGKNPVSKELYFDFTNSIAGFGINDDMGMHKLKFYIMAFPDTIRARTLDELKHSNINVTTDIDSLKRILNEPGSKISIIYPDSLLRMLLKAKVTHVITANLTNYKTVERLMSYIEAKYPRIKTKIMQIGADDSVPASIYKLNYDLYGFKLQP